MHGSRSVQSYSRRYLAERQDIEVMNWNTKPAFFSSGYTIPEMIKAGIGFRSESASRGEEWLEK
jgi:hypothetical protein